jgi:uncharacterized protein YxeA
MGIVQLLYSESGNPLCSILADNSNDSHGYFQVNGNKKGSNTWSYVNEPDFWP